LRVFAFEYVTAGGWREIGAPSSLIAEGLMMLRALARDLAHVPGVEVLVAADPALRLSLADATPVAVRIDDLSGSWRRIAAAADLVWPIAPETDGLLEEMQRLFRAAGREVLASDAAALAIARSKQATADWLQAWGIPAVTTGALAAPPPRAEAWVVKPDDGAGALDTVLLRDMAALTRRRGETRSRHFVVQPFIPGEALSLSMLAQDGEAWLLACNRQDVAVVNGGFRYRGGVVGGAEARRGALAPLAERIAAALPGLWGYVGVDVIDAADGPVILEINPRLTTSYIGLGESLGLNPAALVLALRERPLRTLVAPLAPRPVAIAVPA
jgi:predicted ATP-grasp superfamily ATP-dependent carboligase